VVAIGHPPASIAADLAIGLASIIAGNGQFRRREPWCICEITTAEAEAAMAENPAFDGFGLYLVKVDSRHPRKPASVLAKFASEKAAAVIARFFRFKAGLEPA
jgi:hypothetical protein